MISPLDIYSEILAVTYKLSTIIRNGIDIFWPSHNKPEQKKYWEYYCDTSPKTCGTDSVNLQWSCGEGEIPYTKYLHVFNFTKNNGNQKIVSHGDIVTKKDIRDKCITPEKFYKTLCIMLDKDMRISVERIPDRLQKDLVNEGGMFTPRKVYGSPEEAAIKTLYYHTSLARDSGYYECIMQDNDGTYDSKCENITIRDCPDLFSNIKFDENGQVFGHSLILYQEYYGQ